MTPQLDQLLESLALNRIPALWTAKSYPSLKPLLSYCRDLARRVTFLQSWIDRGSAPIVFWLPGFFFTQSFFTGVKQNFARKETVPIDQVEFEFSVLDHVLEEEE